MNELLEPGEPPITRNRWRVSLVWLVPIVAALIGIGMLVQTWHSVGPEIQITFKSATGLQAGKTPVKYKDVTVGSVTAIALSDDGSQVVATVSLVKSAASLTRKDTRYWVVRPRIGASGISGIDTLFSGAYVAVDAGTQDEFSETFTGLETPPPVIGGAPGKSFMLHGKELGRSTLARRSIFDRFRLVASRSISSTRMARASACKSSLMLL